MATVHSLTEEEKAVVLSADERAALEEGLNSAATEPLSTLEEAIDFARQRREQWMKPPSPKPR